MPQIIDIYCPACRGEKSIHPVHLMMDGKATIHGVMKCGYCGHELPLTLSDGALLKLDTALPGAQSDKLNSAVPIDIQEDVREAERANFAQCYKAAATMCRRALQLGLIEKSVEDAPLSTMINNAFDREILSKDTFVFANSIKGFGDIGAHRKEVLEPQEIYMLIYATVKMLNELFSSA